MNDNGYSHSDREEIERLRARLRSQADQIVVDTAIIKAHNVEIARLTAALEEIRDAEMRAERWTDYAGNGGGMMARMIRGIKGIARKALED